jgi:hypothetical protein
LLHAAFIKDLRVIAHHDEVHAQVFERVRYAVERFLSVGKTAMKVKHTAHGLCHVFETTKTRRHKESNSGAMPANPANAMFRQI